MFKGREEDLAHLEEIYGQGHGFIAVTGVKNVGKTYLLKRFSEGKNVLYYQCREESNASILRGLSKAVSEKTVRPLKAYSTWSEALEDYARYDGDSVIIIDDAHNILYDVPTVRDIGDVWRSVLSEKNIMLILSTEDAASIRRASEERGAPLADMLSETYTVSPIKMEDAMEGSYRRAVRAYSITGGIPYYMNFLEYGSLKDRIRDLFFTPYGLLNEEAPRILGNQLRDLRNYNTYIRAMISGMNRLSDITAFAGVNATTAMPYIRKLVELGVVERNVPVNLPENSRTGRYEVVEGMIAFWYRFVYPYRTEILAGNADRAIRDFEDNFASFVTSYYLKECGKNFASRLCKAGKDVISGDFVDEDISIRNCVLDRGDRVLYIMHTSMKKAPIDRSFVKDVVRTSVPGGYDTIHCIFSVSGFESSALVEASSKNILLFNEGRPVSKKR